MAMKIEVLVTTMHATGFEKFYEMNIQTDVVIANQADRCEYQETEINGCRVRMITTNTRGTGINRNMAISYACGDLIVFADDDVVFEDGYATTILNSFEKCQGAEAIRFNCKNVNKTSTRQNTISHKFQKGKVTNMMSGGVWGLAIRRNQLLKYDLLFPIGYGPACDVYMGEDSIFIKKMLEKLNYVYCSDQYIASISMDESSWYEGVTPRYLRNLGYLNGAIYGRLAYINMVRRAHNLSKRDVMQYTFVELIKMIHKGVNDYLKDGNM